MRLWIFDFDGTTTSCESDRAKAQLDSSCESMIKKLTESPSDLVAIISNRNIYNIIDRINIPGVIYGGCYGVEWMLPSGFRIGTFRNHEDDLIRSRHKLLPQLSKIAFKQRVEIEDNLWSVTIHANTDLINSWNETVKKIRNWSSKRGLTFNNGSNHLDIQLIPGFNKSVGISYLARVLNLEPAIDSIIYAGNEESDVVACWWTMFFGGTAIMVGNNFDVPGVYSVANSSELATIAENFW